MSRNVRSLFLLIVGVIFGMFLPIIMKHHITTDLTRCPSKRASSGRGEDTTSSRHVMKNKKLLFVGVMTAEKFLDTRAKAVYETWAKEMPGTLKFFASSSSKRTDLPVVSLEGVDDSYPPQRKSMMMLKYMHDNFIDEYEWFLRSDDDVYMRMETMERFLRTLNSSEDLYIGQAGTGTKSEKGRLSLGWGDNFCMGGPSAILSSSTLRKVTPYLEHCLQNLVTTHEDVEVGRCIKKFVGISCTWAFEMQSLFYHNQSKEQSYTFTLDTKSVRNAITLHPLKKPEYMYRMHSHFKELKIRELSYESITYQRKLDVLNTLLDRDADEISDNELAALNDIKHFHQKMSKEESPDWEMFTPRKLYSYRTNSPEIGMMSPTKDALNSVLGQTMSIINREARKVLHRTLEFKRLNHGYRRYHPLYGMQYMLDLLMKYHRHIGRNRRRMTVHVRHHAYLQQPFGDMMHSSQKISLQKKIHFILPLAGRLEQFKKFMHTYEKVCLRHRELTTLVVLYFNDVASPDKHFELYKKYKKKYPTASLEWINMKGRFSRALALTMGASQYEKSALLFFCDVDLDFNFDFLTRCRANTILGRQLYYPIVFSQFAPEVAYCKTKKPNTSFVYTDNAGFWREYAFGITCQHRVDFDMIGGFDTTIQGWGMEDVDLYDRYVQSDKYVIFRAPDPDLVHIYHEVVCDPNLTKKQLDMCYTSKSQTYGSQASLYKVLLEKGYLSEE
ncbi:chondroitin sulfate synthase 1-like [Hydractinia symbiolongicarpus]|uniref:chondroitin sulfate synthase 1-like n=1 Tax=Hydractinia symbiolongicarpus TaxID=13093 RepID=UPI00254A168A|nr:chondroitin sulfate synthase 1-like [Hydractinia symbiolongicarpus]